MYKLTNTEKLIILTEPNTASQFVNATGSFLLLEVFLNKKYDKMKIIFWVIQQFKTCTDYIKSIIKINTNSV